MITTVEVLYIEYSSHRKNGKDLLPVSGTTLPHDITKDSLLQSGRERIAPPLVNFYSDLIKLQADMLEHRMTSMDYLPELLEKTTLQTGEPWSLRTDIKPLEIIQPEGVSFTLEGMQFRNLLVLTFRF